MYKQFNAQPGERVSHIDTEELPEICMVEDLPITYPQYGFYIGQTSPNDPPQQSWLCQDATTCVSSVTTVENGEVPAEDMIVGPTPDKKPPHA